MSRRERNFGDARAGDPTADQASGAGVALTMPAPIFAAPASPRPCNQPEPESDYLFHPHEVVLRAAGQPKRLRHGSVDVVRLEVQ